MTHNFTIHLNIKYLFVLLVIQCINFDHLTFFIYLFEAPKFYCHAFVVYNNCFYIERIFNVKHLNRMKEGGHFPALEKPRLLIKDIRIFFKELTL